MQIKIFLEKSTYSLLLGFATTNAWSFGGGGGEFRDRCVEPQFKNTKPAKLIAPGGEFSFTASDNTIPDSIKVIIKGHEVDLDVRNDYGYQVKGNLPDGVTGYALIKISAHSQPKTCVGEFAWLVKVEEDSSASQSSARQSSSGQSAE